MATLHVREKGAGPALVLLHGFPLDGRMWASQLDALSSRCRVIAPDFRGFGQSQSVDTFTVESMADDVHALVTALGIGPVVLGGLSMGGYVAQAFVRKYPAALRALMLIDTKPQADNTEAKAARQKSIDLVNAKGPAAIADAMIPKLIAPDAAAARPALARDLRTMIESQPAHSIANALAALRDRPDFESHLASIAVPTLIIVGDQDAITPPAVAESMHNNIPRSELALIKGAGHMSPMEQPAQVNRAMEMFLA